MLSFLRGTISDKKLKELAQRAVEAAEAGRTDDALRILEPVRRAQRKQLSAADSLLWIVDRRCLPLESAFELFLEVSEAYPQNPGMLVALGKCAEAVRDIDDLNAPPPDHPEFGRLVEELSALLENNRDPEQEEDRLRALSTAARMMARQADDIAERSYRRLVEIAPENSAHHYNLGLFCKTRGRFEEGLEANREAIDLAQEAGEEYEWNLGICATGCGDGATALEVWKRMEQKIEMGRFGLPEGGYPETKVKLAERPLAERGADNDDPGLEETIWIERLSPCHGIVRSVLYQDLGVDYGDVVLFDGAPITYHKYGEMQIPVFPHLATLVRGNYRFFDFAGTQDEAGRLADISADLERDAVVYCHTEMYRELCASCWRDPDLDHDRHERMEKHVVTGRIAAPPDMEPADLLDQIDGAVSARGHCQIYAPDLCRAAGQEERASVEQKRHDMLRHN